jgi:hypothetical protein
METAKTGKSESAKGDKGRAFTTETGYPRSG